MSGLFLHRLTVVLAVAAFLGVAAGAMISHPGTNGSVLGVARAVGLHFLFASAVLLTVVTSAEWKHPAAPMHDGGWPPLRTLAVIAPVTVVVQVALGAAYRQDLVGLIPHASWAFLASVAVLAAAAIVLTQEESPRTMRRWAGAVLGATLLQVMLGVLAFVARLTAQDGPVPGWMTGMIHAHVGTGSLVLGFTAALSAWILHSVVTTRRESRDEVVTTGRQS